MKFFTPQRYIAFASDDPVAANRADGAWERAIAEYRRHLKKIQKKLPATVYELASKTCLHDAAYLGLTQVPAVAWLKGGIAIVAVQQDDRVAFLMYLLVDEPISSAPVNAAVFAPQKVHWLYDEVDIRPDGVFLHEILWSDGRMLTLQFIHFRTITLSAAAGAVGSASAERTRPRGTNKLARPNGAAKRHAARTAAVPRARRKTAVVKNRAAS